ncbi:H-2 class II histocompatibility antigen, A-U alpha chain-like [Synchiropus splendidus]|uniref:H-2 class II histocompatibility antigen, A-U alpha chain-like n=1 Tax=Synchiropus splendidus TaxID=270530 RepID=UPI00237E8618|nr:H-2 class II histocompatibility antigen, A-U alpha chain-like [Synchiropus splendidus]
MKLSLLLFLVVDISFTDSEVFHHFSCTLGCFENGSTEALCTLDSEELVYADFAKRELVYTVPKYISTDKIIHFDHDKLYNSAEDGKGKCLKLLQAFDIVENHPPEVKEPPVSIIYPAEEVLPGEKNRLVCFISDFYPPAVNVTWTKNSLPVSRGVWNSRYYASDDYTFRHISTLTFMPEEGDVYTCGVEHQAMAGPDIKTWEVKFSQPGVTADLVCVLGLTAGVALMAAGIILACKSKVRKDAVDE